MREAQKVERVWLAFSPLLPVRNGVWPTRDQARILCMEFQPELLQAVSSLRQESRCIRSMLEAEHNVIGKAVGHLLGQKYTFTAEAAPGFGWFWAWTKARWSRPTAACTTCHSKRSIRRARRWPSGYAGHGLPWRSGWSPCPRSGRLLP